MKSKFFSLALILCLILSAFAPAAVADYIYTYTGKSLTSPTTNTTVSGIVFTMTLSAPLAAGEELDAGDLLHWSISAGSVFPPITDSSGVKIIADFIGHSGGMPGIWGVNISNSSGLRIFTGNTFGDFLVDPSVSDSFFNSAWGKWTIQSTSVPEPGLLLLIGIGVSAAFLASLARRR